MILNTAFDIARISALDQVSNREIAKRLNCSIRPIYYQFRDVQEMNSELIKKIWQYFYDYIFTKREQFFDALSALEKRGYRIKSAEKK